MAGFRVTIPLTRDLHQQQQQQRQASLHQQQQQRQAPPQQSDQNLQFSLTGADDEADPYIPFLSEASPPPQHQDNLASADPAVNLNMAITGSELVSGETPLDLFPVSPSFTVSHPGDSGGETSLALALVTGGPSFTVSHPRGSDSETSLALVTGGPSFTVSHPRGSSGETSLDLVTGGPSSTVSHPRGSGGETSLDLVTGCPSFTENPPSGSGGETSLALVTGGPSFTENPPSVSPGRVKKMRERRGPPSSSANNDELQALDSSGVGVGFTPHIFIILPGEDVAAKIMEFNMNGPRSVCVFSASGCISNVTLRHPTISCGTVGYEGLFDIISLSGSFVPVEMDGYINMTGGLTVSLSRLNNDVFGGTVVGPLVASTPVQVFVGSFTQDGHNKPDQMEFYTPTLPNEDPAQGLMVLRNQ